MSQISKSPFGAEQLFLLREERASNIVNVASVPQRSPFRYPGGKTWLVPRIRQWLAARPKPTVFIEPFAGGGIVSLTVAFEKLADSVLMVELDPLVAAVWETVLHKNDAAWLSKRIVEYSLTREGCERDIKAGGKTKREQAFLTILRNRVCRGGILAKGAGFIEYGENGKGVHSRWYPQTLKRRIDEIQMVADRISFRHTDAFEVINEYKDKADIVWFVDPPYTSSKKSAGSRLYNCFDLDHRRLFELMSECVGDVLLTYDKAPEVQALADEFGLKTRGISMKNNHHAEMRELLIARDFDWMS